MQNDDIKEYLRKLGEFFYPFLGNVELGNVSALENTTNLINAFINFNEVGYFNRPTALLNNRESCCFDMPVLVKDACNSCVILPILTLTY